MGATGFIIMISGRQGSGKSTLSRNIEAKFRAMGLPVTRIAFADPLYRMHHAVRAILQELGIDSLSPDMVDGPLLQVLGTEWGRRTRHPDIWVDALKARVNDPGMIYIIDDCRMQNEITAFDGTAWPSIKIRLECPEWVRRLRAKKWRPNTQHLSEIGLDHYHDFDLTLDTERLKPEETCSMVLQELQKRSSTNN